MSHPNQYPPAGQQPSEGGQSWQQSTPGSLPPQVEQSSGFIPAQAPPLPGYGYPPPGSPAKRSATGPIALALVLVLVIAGGALGAWWYFGDDADSVVGTADENNRVEDTEAGVSYIEMDGWELTASDEDMHTYSYLYHAGNTEGADGAVYGIAGEGADQEISERFESTVELTADLFFPGWDDVESISSEEVTIDGHSGHDYSATVWRTDGEDMYVRLAVAEIGVEVIGMIGMADRDNQAAIDQVDSIMESMEFIGA